VTVHKSITLVLVVVAANAAAQPITRPDGCRITIVLAPDDVRATIEEWLRGEPECGMPLEVRVVPTDGGLYLQARDDRGAIRERVVPDGHSAAVLVASWMAEPPPQRTTVDVHVDISTSAPSVRVTPSATETMPPAPPTAWRRLVLGGVVGSINDQNVSGVRAELDLVRFGKWSFGATAAALHSTTPIDVFQEGARYPPYITTASVDLLELRGLVYVARIFGSGPWHARAAGALGFASRGATSLPQAPQSVEYADTNQMDQLQQHTTATAELSFLLSRDIGDCWGLEAGAVVIVRHDLNPLLFVGLHHRL
jgi:hypothetical protein